MMLNSSPKLNSSNEEYYYLSKTDIILIDNYIQTNRTDMKSITLGQYIKTLQEFLQLHKNKGSAKLIEQTPQNIKDQIVFSIKQITVQQDKEKSDSQTITIQASKKQNLKGLLQESQENCSLILEGPEPSSIDQFINEIQLILKAILEQVPQFQFENLSEKSTQSQQGSSERRSFNTQTTDVRSGQPPIHSRQNAFIPALKSELQISLSTNHQIERFRKELVQQKMIALNMDQKMRKRAGNIRQKYDVLEFQKKISRSSPGYGPVTQSNEGDFSENADLFKSQSGIRNNMVNMVKPKRNDDEEHSVPVYASIANVEEKQHQSLNPSNMNPTSKVNSKEIIDVIVTKNNGKTFKITRKKGYKDLQTKKQSGGASTSPNSQQPSTFAENKEDRRSYQKKISKSGLQIQLSQLNQNTVRFNSLIKFYTSQAQQLFCGC